MRALPAALAEAIDGEAAILATAWILTRSDGVVLGFTDHDLTVQVSGVACAPQSGWTAGTADAALGFTPGQASATGVLSSDAIVEADIALGVYDRARVETWRISVGDPTAQVLMRRETIQRLVRTGEGFTAELEGSLAALRRVVGRAYDRGCDAVFGDGRCRVDLTAFPGAVCDKRYATCRDRFANTANFQGFPDVPGDDYLLVNAATSPGLLDGGSRR